MAVGARVLAMLILGIPTVVYGDSASLVTLAVLGAIWTLSTLTERLNWVNLLVLLVEAAVVGGLAALSLGSGLDAAAPPWPCRRSPRGCAGASGAWRLALSVELVVLLLVSLRLVRRARRRRGVQHAHLRCSPASGSGLIASYVHSQLQRPPPTRSRPTATPSGCCGT